MKAKELTAERLRELLSYDPETGVFTWRVGGHGRRSGDVAGCDNGAGYVKIIIDGRNRLAHRLAWLYTHGRWPECFIDHRNGDRADNRIANLRECSPAQNQHNRHRADRGSASGLIGAHRQPHSRRWRATIKAGGKHRHIGTFDTPEAAHAAYLQAKRELHPFWAAAA